VTINKYRADWGLFQGENGGGGMSITVSPHGERLGGFQLKRCEAGFNPCSRTAWSRADKYDRYLADVFYGAAADTVSYILESGAYLNRLLLREGLAAHFEGHI
jgi:hypothetical protein